MAIHSGGHYRKQVYGVHTNPQQNMTARLSIIENTLSSDGKTKARKSSPAASSRSIWQSCVDNLLATYAINMTFCSWIRLENLVGFLASLAPW